MAINYTNLFTMIGKAIKAANYYKSTFATMKSNGQALSQVIADQDLDYLGDGIANNVSSHISGLSAGCAYYQNKVTEILLDPTLVTDNLAITNRQLSTVLPALYADMSANAEYILQTIATVGTPSLLGSGNGELLTSLELDDISSPVSGAVASFMLYKASGENGSSELVVADTVYCRCISSNVEGQEQFTLFGNNLVPPFSELTESLGSSKSIQTVDSLNLLSNGDFEIYSAGFTGWTITDDGGTTTQETSAMYRGTSAVRVSTLANADNVVFEQTLSESLTPGQAYFLGIKFKSVTAESGNNLACVVSLYDGATLLTSSNIANISINDTNWHTAKEVLVVPYITDATNILTVKISASPTADGVDAIIFDSAFLVPVTYFNGVGFAILNGSTRFRVGDLFSSAVSRSSSGVIQEFFRKTYGVQLPSAISGDETIADSLAT